MRVLKIKYLKNLIRNINLKFYSFRMTFTLKQRKTNLKKLCKKTNLKTITDLISTGLVKKNNLSYIQNASKILLQSCLVGSSKKVEFDFQFNDVIKRIKKKKPENITHNGLVVVRKESSSEYALFLKSLFCFLEEIGLLKKLIILFLLHN